MRAKVIVLAPVKPQIISKGVQSSLYTWKLSKKSKGKSPRPKNTKAQITSSARKSVSKVFNNLSTSPFSQRILVLLHWYVTDLIRICFWPAYRIGWEAKPQQKPLFFHLGPYGRKTTRNTEESFFFTKIGHPFFWPMSKFFIKSKNNKNYKLKREKKLQLP